LKSQAIAFDAGFLLCRRLGDPAHGSPDCLRCPLVYRRPAALQSVPIAADHVLIPGILEQQEVLDCSHSSDMAAPNARSKVRREIGLAISPAYDL
jgi:hypothetical protein